MNDELKTISAKKQIQYDVYNKQEIAIGDHLIVKLSAVSRMNVPETKTVDVVVISANPLVVEYHTDKWSIDIASVISKQCFNVGADPFDKHSDNVKPVNFSLDSILFSLHIIGNKYNDECKFNGIIAGELNWNPYVYLPDGTKKYYQRDFVWTESDNQLLIESIYQNIYCGKILVRTRSWDELQKLADSGDTELFFNEIVDGKQRLNAIRLFIQDKFCDLSGNYYSDLSTKSQHKFSDHQLFSYGLIENATDAQVIRQFLKLNHMGVPQSKEHIDFIKEVNASFKG